MPFSSPFSILYANGLGGSGGALGTGATGGALGTDLTQPLSNLTPFVTISASIA